MQHTDYKALSKIEWLFVDLNSYFASIEQLLRPELRGKPVAVVPMMTDGTCAIAASYEAKAYGIKTGTKIFEAKRMCPDLTCILARHDVYVDYHHRIFDEVERHIPVTKRCSVDEAACRLFGQDQNPAAARALAYAIKNGIAQNIGSVVRCSIGIAPNAYLAKVASDMRKPDGLTILEPDHLKTPLCRLSLTDLTGINVGYERRLNKANIYTVEDLWNTTPKQLRQIWRSVQGERFWYKLHGYNVPDTPTQKRVVGHSRMLDPRLRPIEPAYQVTRFLLNKAMARLRRYGMYTRNLSLSIQTMERHRWRNDIGFAAIQDSFQALEYLDMLWDQMIRHIRPTLLRKVSIMLTHLEDESRITPDLFDSYARTDRRENLDLSSALDDLNKRYGAHTVTVGTHPKTEAGYVGTKIAFNRIPEREEFSE